MATLRRGESLSTREPGIEIDAGLPVGRHVFQLVVEDDSRIASAPDQIIVEIQRVVLDTRDTVDTTRIVDLDPRVRPTPIAPVTPVTPVRPVTPVTPVRPTRRAPKKRKPT